MKSVNKKNSIIDIHHQPNPPFYVEELERYGMTKVYGLKQQSGLKTKCSRMIEENNLSKAVMSISVPGVY